MFLIVGLGNPEEKYAKTFHNLGFLAAGDAAEALGVRFKKKECEASVAEAFLGGEKVIVARPVTYMNASGRAVKQLMKLLTEHPVDDAYPSYFLYSDDKSREELLLPKLKGQNMLPLRLHYSSVGPTIGTHIGPGALGIAYTERMD